MCGRGVKSISPGIDTVVASIDSPSIQPLLARTRIQVMSGWGAPLLGQSEQECNMSNPRCRLCSSELRHTFVDLGMSPPCESYLSAAQLDAGETFYPLHVRICENCLLVQLPAYIAPEDVFSDYAYFSSYSDSWVAHARRFVDTAATQLELGEGSFV